jgi:molybdopterin converting factor small subunit
MKIQLLFFSVLSDIAGKRADVWDVPDGTSAGNVWQRFREEHRQVRDFAHPLIAINQSYADADQVLRDGDELVFIPPVQGG